MSRVTRQLAKRIRNTPTPVRGVTRRARPAVTKYGFVVSIDAAGSPPTCTITLGGSSVPIPGVAMSDNYQTTGGPGDTVKIEKNGPDLMVICAVAS